MTWREPEQQISSGWYSHLSLRDLVNAFFKHKWATVLIVLTTMISTVFYVFVVRTDVYEVSAKLMVKLGREQSPPPTVGLPPMVVSYRTADINSEVEILKSTELLARVVDHFELDRPATPAPVPERFFPRMRYYAKKLVRDVKDGFNELLIRFGVRERLSPREFAIFQLQRGLTVTPQRESNVIIATLALPMREGSSAILNQLLAFYLDFRRELYEDESSFPFFRDAVERAASVLEEGEARLRDFDARWNISAIDKQKEVLLSRIAQAEHSVHEAEIRLEEASAKVVALEREFEKRNPDIGAVGAFERGSFPDNVLLELAELQRERENLRMTELDDGIRIENNRQQFRALLDVLASHLKSVHAEARSEYEARVQELQDLRQQIASLHEKETEWRSLRRAVDTAEANLGLYQTKLEEASANVGLGDQQAGNVVVVQHAMDPFIPAGMRKATVLAMAGVLGLLASIGWVFLAELFDHRVYTPESLESYLAAPVLATVPAGRPLHTDEAKTETEQSTLT